jgi:hypothetical protein
MRCLAVSLNLTIAIGVSGPLSVSAKEYTITPLYSAGHKVIFETPPGWKQGAVSQQGDEIIFRLANVSSSPQLSITVRHLSGENPSDPQEYAEDFVSFVDAQKAMGQKDSSKSELTNVESFDTPANGKLLIWCVRCSTYHDYFITEIIDGDMQVEIRLESLDADEIRDKISGLKALASSVQILDR